MEANAETSSNNQKKENQPRVWLEEVGKHIVLLDFGSKSWNVKHSSETCFSFLWPQATAQVHFHHPDGVAPQPPKEAKQKTEDGFLSTAQDHASYQWWGESLVQWVLILRNRSILGRILFFDNTYFIPNRDIWKDCKQRRYRTSLPPTDSLNN